MQVVTSGSFVSLWFTPVTYQAFEVVTATTFIDIGPNTAMEARLLECKTGQTASVASWNNATRGAVSKLVRFAWITTGVAVGMDQVGEKLPIYRFEVRRTSGASNVTVYVPAWHGGPQFLFGCAANGSPTVQ